MEAELGRSNRLVKRRTSCSECGETAMLSKLASSRFQFLQQLIESLRTDFVMEVVIHLHGRSPGAGADALDFFQGEQTVGSCFPVSNPQLFASMLKQFFAAAQHARDVGANLQMKSPSRFLPQHGIIRDSLFHLQN